MQSNQLDLSDIARWQATALCAGFVLLVVPLIALPIVAAELLHESLPVGRDAVVAIAGIGLSLSTVLVLAPLLGVPHSSVFVRRPDRSAVLWTGFGCLLVLAIVTMAIVASRGSVDVDPARGTKPMRILLLAALLATWPAVLEEFLLRGYLLGVVGRRWNWPAAICITSTLFALLHHGHATGVASLVLYVGTTGIAGVLFGLVTLSTGTVWNAVAIHAVWNTLFSEAVLQFRPIGEPTGDALLEVAVRAESLLVGGGVVDVPNSPLAILVLAAGVGAVVRIDRWRSM